MCRNQPSLLSLTLQSLCSDCLQHETYAAERPRLQKHAGCVPATAHRRLHPGVEHIKYAATASSFVAISHRCMGTTKAVGVLLPLSKHCISGTRPSTFLGNVQAGAVGVACSVIKHEPFKFVALHEMYRLGRLELLAAS